MNRKKKIILSAVLTAVGICAVILALVWRPQKPDAGLSPSHSAATTAPQETTGQSQTMEPDATEESTGPTASAPTASDPTWEPAPSGSATEPPGGSKRKRNGRQPGDGCPHRAAGDGGGTDRRNLLSLCNSRYGSGDSKDCGL